MTGLPRNGSFGVIIPARFGSTRLAGKALLDLGGKPMVVRVLELARKSNASFTVVATDDERIVQAVTEAGGVAMLTSPNHLTGTDRLAEVVRRMELAPETVVVNLQGDEPTLPPDLVDLVAHTLMAWPDASLATLAAPLTHPADLFDPNVVKVVADARGRALYFSRAPIPWVREAFTAGGAPPAELPLPPGGFLRHIGLYAYRVATLQRLSETTPAGVERAESLEQLRALWLGMGIQLALTPTVPAAGVDTAEEAIRVRKLFEA